LIYTETQLFSPNHATVEQETLASIKASYPIAGKAIEKSVELSLFPKYLSLPEAPQPVVSRPEPSGANTESLQNALLRHQLNKAERDTYLHDTKEFAQYRQATEVIHESLSKSFKDQLHASSAIASKAFLDGNPMLYWKEVLALARGDTTGSKMTLFSKLIRRVNDIYNSPDGNNTIDRGTHIKSLVRQLLTHCVELSDDDVLADKVIAHAYLSNLNTTKFGEAKKTVGLNALSDKTARHFPSNIEAVRSLVMNLSAGYKPAAPTTPPAPTKEQVNLAQTGPKADKGDDGEGSGGCTKCHPTSRMRFTHTTEEHVSGYAPSGVKRGGDGTVKESPKKSPKQVKFGLPGRQKNGNVVEKHNALLSTIRPGAISGVDMPSRSFSTKGSHRRDNNFPVLALDTGTSVCTSNDRALLSNVRAGVTQLSTLGGDVDVHLQGDHALFGGVAAYTSDASVGLANFKHISERYDIKSVITEESSIDRKCGLPVKEVTGFVFQLRDRENYPAADPDSELTFRVERDGENRYLFLLQDMNKVLERVHEGARADAESEDLSSDPEEEYDDSGDEGGEEFE
jgi:hypothetical protein